MTNEQMRNDTIRGQLVRVLHESTMRKIDEKNYAEAMGDFLHEYVNISMKKV